MWPFKIILTSLKKNNNDHGLWMSTKASGHEEKKHHNKMRVGKRKNSMEIKVVVNLPPLFSTPFLEDWTNSFFKLRISNIGINSNRGFWGTRNFGKPWRVVKSGRFPPTNKLKGKTRKNSEKPNSLWHPGCFRRFLVQRLGAWYSIWITQSWCKVERMQWVSQTLYVGYPLVHVTFRVCLCGVCVS